MLIYPVAQSLALGMLAISTLRMKCFWSPYICILAASGVGQLDLWSLLVSRLSRNGSEDDVGRKSPVSNFVRHLVLGFCVLALYVANKERIYEQLGDLR